jgi:glycosyltransferase involved in cell wall biosynthesis
VKKTISIIGSAGIPARYGGFETLTEQISLRLKNEFNIIVACSSYHFSQSYENDTIERIYSRFQPNGISSIIYDFISICKVIHRTDCILLLGSSAAFTIPFFKLLRRNVTFFYHPDGMEWRRKKWNYLAKLYLQFANFIGVIYANKIIIDNDSLIPYYKRWKNKIEIIAYGGDQYKINYQVEKQDYWLTIARAEPENNIECILDFFSSHQDFKWVLVSNFQSSKYGKFILKKASILSNIKTIESEYNTEALAKLLAECKGYIHGHSSGGTNPTLVAAMWAKVPLICHDNEFNRTTTGNTAFYFKNVQDLEEIILFKDLVKEIEDSTLFFKAQTDYNWEKIIEKYRKMFKS